MSSWYKKVHVFLPITSKKEINTWLIIDRIRSVGEVVVSISDFSSNTIVSFQKFCFLGANTGVQYQNDMYVRTENQTVIQL